MHKETKENANEALLDVGKRLLMTIIFREIKIQARWRHR